MTLSPFISRMAERISTLPSQPANTYCMSKDADGRTCGNPIPVSERVCGGCKKRLEEGEGEREGGKGVEGEPR